MEQSQYDKLCEKIQYLIENPIIKEKHKKDKYDKNFDIRLYLDIPVVTNKINIVDNNNVVIDNKDNTNNNTDNNTNNDNINNNINNDNAKITTGKRKYKKRVSKKTINNDENIKDNNIENNDDRNDSINGNNNDNETINNNGAININNSGTDNKNKRKIKNTIKIKPKKIIETYPDYYCPKKDYVVTKFSYDNKTYYRDDYGFVLDEELKNIGIYKYNKIFYFEDN